MNVEMIRKVGFAIIGAGAAGERHGLALRHLDIADIVGIYDTNSQSADALATSLCTQSYTHLQKLLEQPGLDVVCICTPPGTHAQIAITALKAGKHVLVEKPFDFQLQRIDQVIEVGQAVERYVGAVSQHRFAPTVLTLRYLINSGALGNVNSGSIRVRRHRNQSYYEKQPWRNDSTFAGGGALLTLGIHYLDVACCLLGKVSQVKALEDSTRTGGKIEDCLVGALRFEQGTLLSLEISNIAFPGEPDVLELQGDKGLIQIQGDQVKGIYPASLAQQFEEVHSQKSQTTAPSVLTPKATLHYWQLEDFARAVLTGYPPTVMASDVRPAIEVALALYQDAR